jgi:dTDP-4-dehydrorhamnose reductase
MSTEKIRQVFGCTPPSWQDALERFLKTETEQLKLLDL